MTSLDTEALQEVMSGKKRNTVITEEVKEVIHDGVNAGYTVGEIVKGLNGNLKKDDEGFIPYQYVYNYLQRQLKKLDK